MLLSSGISNVKRPLLELFSRYSREHKWWILFGVLTSLVAPIIGILPPYILQTAIDSVLLDNRPFALFGLRSGLFPVGQADQLYLLGGILAIIGIVSAILSWSAGWVWGRFSQEVQHKVRVDTYTKAQKLGMPFYESEQTGQIMTVLNNDVRSLNNVLGKFIGQVVSTSATIVGVTVLLFILHWEFALISLFFVPAIVLVTRYFIRRLKVEHAAVKQRIGVVNSKIENNLSGMHVIKSYTRETQERDRVASVSRGLYDKFWNVIDLRIRFQPSLNVLNTAGFTLMLVLGGIWIVEGPPLLFSEPLSEGTLVAFLVYQQRLIQPIIQTGQLIDQYYGARASAVRVLSLHDHEAREHNSENAITVDHFDGHIEFDDMSFGYRDNTVLTDVNFTANAGDFIGIVGSTGSGKSTLLKLLLRFYEPDKGEIRVDDHNIKDIKINDLRKRIGIVHQDTHLFSGTIGENLGYGAAEATEEDIKRAARLANAHDFIMEFPDGYETNVGEGGAKLSGGQRQRIALARSLVSDPDILLLDEATSHVDNETERQIQDSLETVVQDRTTFAVAHRLSTIRNADQIVVLDDGEIIEQGTHQDLINQNGKYAQLWSIHIGDNQRAEPVQQ
ncbi:xenobiotic-transporting ATPase [Haloferax elongans ATCC BAA-1513]|uniref:Xenobiotic-transporting ATPase n=2 Tax=Haloferax elongans TaxID=403191 RepID=M0HYE7_HALEO|nr:xenobiotic-transporting ATPase [Haloferax elongans ATCC BAA-1513]